MAVMISEEAAARIVAGKPFGEKHDRWSIGYRTKGGTYVIASNGRQSDAQRPRDLVVILPGVWGPDGHESRVLPLTPLVNPDFVALIRELVDETT
jgi:hypothetical protein